MEFSGYSHNKKTREEIEKIVNYNDSEKDEYENEYKDNSEKDDEYENEKEMTKKCTMESKLKKKIINDIIEQLQEMIGDGTNDLKERRTKVVKKSINSTRKKNDF